MSKSTMMTEGKMKYDSAEYKAICETLGKGVGCPR